MSGEETRGGGAKKRRSEKGEIRGEKRETGGQMTFVLDMSQEAMERMRAARDAALRGGGRFLDANSKGFSVGVLIF